MEIPLSMDLGRSHSLWDECQDALVFDKENTCDPEVEAKVLQLKQESDALGDHDPHFVTRLVLLCPLMPRQPRD